MVTARRVGKWALYTVGGCVALVILARVVVGVYLATPAGKSMVARKVSDQIGLPVEVTSVRVGLFTSSIGMRVFDPSVSDPAKSEILAVEDADADISLFGLALGHISPEWVRLRGVNLTLHVAANGDVITTLPRGSSGGSGGGGGGGALPVIELASGKITIQQDGRPEFALKNLALRVESSGSAVKLSGSVDDPEWAKWTIAGDINRDTKRGSVELTTPDGPLTMDRLGSVPFVPPVVWEQVRPDGRGEVAVKLWTATAGQVEYSVDIKPHAAALTLPEASVTLAGVTGTIHVTGARVELQGTRADLAGGTIAVDGAFDFGVEPTTVNLKVAGQGLVLHSLPPEWKFPNKFDGKLNGTANLALKLYADGHIDPAGSGEGKITDVTVLGFKSEDDIPIHLRQKGKRYEFVEPPKQPQQQPKEQPQGSRFPIPESVVPASVLCLVAWPGQDKKPADPPKTDAPKVDPKKEPPKKGTAPDDIGTESSLDASIRLKDIDIAELLQKLDVKLGYKLGGKISVEVKIAVPLTAATNVAAYEFAGSISSPALIFEGLTVRDVSAKAVFKKGVLTLSDLSGKIDQPDKSAAGTFRGTASAAVQPPGDASATLTIDRIPLGEVLKAIPNATLAGAGTISGKVSLKAPYEKLWDTTLWSGSGSINAPELTFEGRTAKGVRLTAEVAKGVMTLKDAAMNLEGIPVTAEGTFALTDKYAFTATVRTTGTDITDLRKLVPEVTVPAPVEGVLETETKVSGTAVPLTFTATGQVRATKLTLANTKANHVELKWELTRDKLTVSELKADVFGGTVTGSADVPFDATKAGTFDVTFKNLEAGSAALLVPDFPVRIAGSVSGKITGSIPAAKEGQSRVGNINLDLTAPRLTVQGIPSESLTGKLALRGRVLEYELEGKTLGGSFEVKGRYPGEKKKAGADGMGARDRGSFKLTNVDLSRIATEVRFSALAPLRGRVNANFDFENDFSAGSGRVNISRLQWGDTLISEEVTGVLLLRDGNMELSDVTGRVAGGELRARAQVRLNDTARNFFTISVNGADAKKLLAPLGESAGRVDGPVTVVVRGRLGRETRASGTLTLPRGTVSGVAVTDLRIPFELAAAPSGYGRVSVREASVSAGPGRARGELTIDWGTEVRVAGQINFTDVPLRTISPELGENALLGNGRITGRFDIGGDHVRSAADLTGTLVAALNNTSVKEIPVLSKITPFLNPTGLIKPFQSGDVRGSLKDGIFRVQRLALANPAAQLFAEGTITTSGRIDLNVVAHTGTIGPEAGGLRLLGLRLPAIGPVPLTLIQDVSDFLSNRTVKLSITGTTSNPIVRVNVGALLADEAVRFFLTRYIVPADVAGTLGLSAGFGSMNKK